MTSASNPKFVLLFLFLISFYCIKILSRSYGYVEMSNHRIAEPFRFCFAEENNIPKNTDINLALNALDSLA